MVGLNRLSSEQIRQCLVRKSGVTHDIPDQWADAECQKAAVLIPFVQHTDQWHLLYIRRAQHEMDQHGGQVAFAGGKFEAGDEDLKTTALREAHEEIGLHPQDVSILGTLNHHHSISRYQITPVVAQIPWPCQLRPDALEVARIFTIPLSWLADPQNHRIEYRELKNRQAFPVVYFDEYDGEILWGATARMTLSLISLLSR
ncbi:MAG: CoA pyrophosphatase [Gammaproteobacteria bacterium]|nr:CoA pyrophosphatase [Gammaproteobacteria bacterium]MBL7000091.1 CoA pyrophosphatase [Gammaproteobacteria bacterium]